MKQFSFILLSALLFLAACKKSKTPEPAPPAPKKPTVVTEPVINITATSARGVAILQDSGSAVATIYGFAYSYTPGNKEFDNCWDAKHNTGYIYTLPGNITAAITPLLRNTTYYVRGFAANKHGFAFGNEVSFTTLP